MKLKFECFKCGRCCENLYVKSRMQHTRWMTLSLFLLPSERKLFPQKIVEPLYGAGLKGRTRPRPEVIFAYQITESRCPHLTKENLCAIYYKRPIACRAFPLGVILDRRCKWVTENFEEGEQTPKSMLDLGDMTKYHDMLFRYIASYARKYVGMWAWDLKTEKWVKT